MEEREARKESERVSNIYMSKESIQTYLLECVRVHRGLVLEVHQVTRVPRLHLAQQDTGQVTRRQVQGRIRVDERGEVGKQAHGAIPNDKLSHIMALGDGRAMIGILGQGTASNHIVGIQRRPRGIAYML